MAIAFIPVRDQAKVFKSSSESSANKGAVLKRLSTGKKLSDPRDNPSDYQKVSDMKLKLAEHNEAIKQASLGTSLFEVALSTYQLLEEYYSELKSEVTAIKANPPIDATTKKYHVNSVNAKIQAISNLINTTFDGNKIVEVGTGTLSIKVSFTGGYNEVSVVVDKLQGFPNINTTTKLYDSYDTTTTGLGENIDGIITAANNKETAAANYKLLMSGITNLANIDRLAQVQKTNTTAAISALEDIDVQEEVMELMQAQILEELSSEALIKIKESSKHIINLIRA